jgi:hypothetical protein
MPEPRSQIAFLQAGLGGLLRQYQLEVPPNQREYAWREDEVTQLFQDFARAIDDDGVDYFLGTIVTIPRGNGAVEVVDGQQRLATTALLLAAIRDYLSGIDEDVLVESINSGFLNGIDRNTRARVPKLKLNIDDNDLFKAIISVTAPTDVPAPTRPSHELLLGAYDEARAQVQRIVAPYDSKTHGDVLNRWISFIEYNALAVLLSVPDDANAYRMFETLNDRGLRTSQADLIKNYLFGKSGSRFTEVQTRWSYMRGALESLDENDITINFLRHSLVLQRGYLSAKKVYEAVQEIARAEQSAVSFASHLETQANIYVATFNPEHEHWNDYPQAARSAIEVFNLIDIKPMRALILAVASRFEPNETALAFKFLVSLGVRLMIASTVRSGSVEVPLSTAAKAVFDKTIGTVAAMKEQLRPLTPSDQQFREAFERARVASAKLGRYYLRSLEMGAKGVVDPYFIPQDDRSVINLEHVLPLKPLDNWPNVTPEDVDQYAKRLGNLVLMRAADNSHAKSDDFGTKKPIYAASPYVLTSQIAELDEWTADAIVERQKTLAVLALTTWQT